jgi:hypothetical protein
VFFKCMKDRQIEPNKKRGRSVIASHSLASYLGQRPLKI